MREPSVDMFSTVDGFGGVGRSRPRTGVTARQACSPNTTIIDEPVETALPALKAEADGLPMRTIGRPSLVRSLFRLGLVDRLRVLVFPMIHGEKGEGPVLADLPDLDLSLVGTSVIDDRPVLLDYRVNTG